MSDEYDYLFKCVAVGDGGVGKTAITVRFSKGFFTEDYKMTIGVDFHVKTIIIDTPQGPIRTKLQIWDTGGQERFSSIRPMYYRGSLGALLVFDVTNYESFEHLPMWIEEVRANVKNEIPLLLVGNKSDLVDQRTVHLPEINDFTGKHRLYYMETSAKTGEGVGDCFYILACLMIGSGVPDQLKGKGIVYAPGEIAGAKSAPVKATTPAPTAVKAEAKPEITASSVPTPVPAKVTETVIKKAAVTAPAPVKIAEAKPSFELEPELDFAAPPVPEPTPKKAVASVPKPIPEPEIEFEAPPVPEPAPKKPIAQKIVAEPQPEIEFTAPPVPPMSKSSAAPVSSDIEFKLPDEILAETSKKEEGFEITPPPVKPKVAESAPVYTPKAVPFSSNIPVPAPAPEGFKAALGEKPAKASPFIPVAPEEASIPNPILASAEQKQESLADYMPEAIMSKKEQKKLAKQKAKEEKEQAKQKVKEEKEKAKLDKEQKIKDAKEKAFKEIEDKKKAKEDMVLKAKEEKEKFKQDKEQKIREAKEAAEREVEEKRKAKEEKSKKGKKVKEEISEEVTAPESVSAPSPTPAPAAPMFFQAISSKAEAANASKPAPFATFMGGAKNPDKSEGSSLRIIPNIVDSENVNISSSKMTPVPTFSPEKQEQKPKKKEVIICKQCGALLSSDYAFCNKCGAKL